MAIEHCPVCGRRPDPPFLEIADVPALCNALWSSAEEARRAPRGEIALSSCSRCGLIWNTAFDERLVEYSPAYDNSLHFSPSFQSYAEDLARRLVEDHDLRGKRVVEVGPGNAWSGSSCSRRSPSSRCS